MKDLETILLKAISTFNFDYSATMIKSTTMIIDNNQAKYT